MVTALTSYRCMFQINFLQTASSSASRCLRQRWKVGSTRDDRDWVKLRPHSCVNGYCCVDDLTLRTRNLPYSSADAKAIKEEEEIRIAERL